MNEWMNENYNKFLMRIFIYCWKVHKKRIKNKITIGPSKITFNLRNKGVHILSRAAMKSIPCVFEPE